MITCSLKLIRDTKSFVPLVLTDHSVQTRGLGHEQRWKNHAGTSLERDR